VQYSLRDVASVFPDMRAAQSAAAHALHVGEYENALTQLAQALETWQNARRVIDQGPRLLKLDLHSLRIADLDAAAMIDTLVCHLNWLQTALKAQDWSTLADLLEGELDADAADWQRLLLVLADKIAPPR